MMLEHSPDRVDADTVMQWITEPDSVMVLDVGSPDEFETAHVAGSYNVPLTLLGEHAAQLAARLDRKVMLVCQTGVRAAQAQAQLHRVGAQHLHVLAGGVPASAPPAGKLSPGDPGGHWNDRSGWSPGPWCGPAPPPGSAPPASACSPAGSVPDWRSRQRRTPARWAGSWRHCPTTADLGTSASQNYPSNSPDADTSADLILTAASADVALTWWQIARQDPPLQAGPVFAAATRAVAALWAAPALATG